MSITNQPSLQKNPYINNAAIQETTQNSEPKLILPKTDSYKPSGKSWDWTSGTATPTSLLAGTVAYNVISSQNLILEKLNQGKKGFIAAFFPKVESAAQIADCLPTSISEMEEFERVGIEEFDKMLKEFLAIAPEKRTFDNTIRLWDFLYEGMQQRIDSLEGLVQMYVNEDLRNRARDANKRLNDHFLDTLAKYPEIYDAFLQVQKREEKSLNEQYYLSHLLLKCKQMGMHLDQKKKERFAELKKEIDALETQFDRNIEEDKTTIIVSPQDLEGMDESWIRARTADGITSLTCDFPTYEAIIAGCKNSSTRKKVYELWYNCAAQKNLPLAERLILCRHEMAMILEFSSYADYELSVLMLNSTESVQQFLTQAKEVSQPQDEKRFRLMKEKVPLAKQLMQPGEEERFGRWDEYYLYGEYKKSELELNPQQINAYFPVEKTMGKMLDVYRNFFSLNIQEISVKIPGFSEDLRVLEVCKKSSPQKLEGIIFLDLYPRVGKGKHNAISYYLGLAYSPPSGPHYPSIDLVTCNFDKGVQSAPGQPCCMKYQELVSFFHELGHTIHSILGRNEYLAFAGKKVKRDFVETPSVLLERWMRDPYILKKISSHYETHEALPDHLIEKLVQGAELEESITQERFRFQNQLLLGLHNPQNIKKKSDQSLTFIQKPEQLMQQIWRKELPHSIPGENIYFFPSFWHFSKGARTKYHMYLIGNYYGNLLFNEIKRRGAEKNLEPGRELVDPEIGKAYMADILSKGGSEDPKKMVEKFLSKN